MSKIKVTSTSYNTKLEELWDKHMSDVPPKGFLIFQSRELARHDKYLRKRERKVKSKLSWYKDNMVYTGELYNDPIIPPWDSSLGQYQIFIKIIKTSQG